MSSLHAIIATLSTDEKKEFVRILKLRNKRNETKNVELFELLDNEKLPSNIEIVLYGTKAKNAYHALTKRLHDILIDFIATKGFDKESSEEMSALKLLLASRIFFQQKQITIAFKTLAKAEVIAVKHSLFNILNEIYQTQLLHVHLNDKFDIQEVIKKYKSNKLKMEEEENLHLFYATIQAELAQSNPGIFDVINKNMIQFAISPANKLTYQSLFKILQITNQVAYVTRDYQAFLPFVEDACQKIDAAELLKEKHLYDHLQILYFLANTYFRIKNFELATFYLEEMQSNMELEKNKYKIIFWPQFIMLKNLLLIYKGKNGEAIEIIQKFDFDKNAKSDYVNDLKLTLVVAMFFQKEYKKALNLLQNFYHSDQWYIDKIGYIWVIQKNIVEILLLIELDYMDLLESRINSFKRKYTKHLLEHKESIVLDFLKLISVFYYNKEEVYSAGFKKKVEGLLIENKNDTDVFIISFYAWLKAKVNKTDVYETCLHSIRDLSNALDLNTSSK